ncbi:hypothetical protein PENTCL1PPCAC_24663, partial [Pristionchus entomophagus]
VTPMRFRNMPLDTAAAQRLLESISTPPPAECPRPNLAKTPAENLVSRLAFPLTFAAAHVIVARSLWRMARRGERNVGKLTLATLGFVELLMFWAFLPTALGAFETFYSAETFRRFFHAATPITGSLLNILSGCDTFLTLLVCYEFRAVAENAKARTIVCSVRRQLGVYAGILFLSVAVSAFTFGATYAPIWRCGGAKMDVRPVLLISHQLMRAGQYVFATAVIAAPCVLLVLNSAHLSRAITYSTLPTEANELISSKPDEPACKLRALLIAFTASFVVPHVLSLAPLFITPPIVSVLTLLSFMTISNWALFVSRVVCYSLLHKISEHLAKMGVVNVY